MKLRENMQQSHSRDADETLHNAKQECNNEEKKLEALITSEYAKQVAVAKKELNKLKDFLEQEANGLYSYFAANLPKLVE